MRVPKHYIVVEPFAGTSAVSRFMYAKGYDKFVVNDKDKELIGFLRYIRKSSNNINKLSKYYAKHFTDKHFTKDDVEKVESRYERTKHKHTRIHWGTYLIIRRNRRYPRSQMFRTLRTNKDGIEKTAFEIRKYKKATEFYRHENTHLSTEDYVNVLFSYMNQSDAFIFIDPPYIGTEYAYKSKSSSLLKNLRLFAQTAKCKWLLVINSTKETRHKFKPWIIGQYEKMYNYFNKKESLLLISNL